MAAPKGNRYSAEALKGNKFALGVKNPGPTKYNPEKHPEKAKKLAYMGATIDEIAFQFDVTAQTIHYWSQAHPEFAQALVLGKDYSDNRVIHSLYRKALGFEHTVTEEVLGKDGSPVLDAEGNPVTIKKKIYVPPSDTSIAFWLKNRRRQEWRDRHELEVGKAGEFDRMSDQELLAYVVGDIIEGEVVEDDE